MDYPATELHKQEYQVRNLPTRAVTLFATQAQVVRDIKNISLKPGVNEITIVGLTPTTDEQSIKVEGTGTAIITDIAVESLPNREIFEEVYPEYDDDKDASDTSSSSESEESEESEESDQKALDLEDTPQSDRLQAIRAQISELHDELQFSNNALQNAQERLKWLYCYYEGIANPRGEITANTARDVQIFDAQATYESEQNKIEKVKFAAYKRSKELGLQIKDLEEEQVLLTKARSRDLKARKKELRLARKAKVKARKLKQKERQKVKQKDYRIKAEKAREKARVRRELESFWPRTVYTVRIKLERVDFTPIASRRSSITAADVYTETSKNKTPNLTRDGTSDWGVTCDLALTYVTAYASWSPNYDLQLSTTSNTGLLCFDAEIVNCTCETWSDAKVTLSTSQTTATSLHEPIPVLTPWNLKLAGKHHTSNQDVAAAQVIDSREERLHKHEWAFRNNAQNVQKPRDQMFGHDATRHHYRSRETRSRGLREIRSTAARGMMPRLRSDSAEGEYDEKADSGQLLGLKEDDDKSLNLSPELGFQESSYEETGLMTTYDLAGSKTLVPSSTASKQRVARIQFTGVRFSHTVVAKYHAAAYLKAKIHNGAKTAILKGPAGLTLDGSFIGRTTLSHCSVGELLTIPLGIDPAIRVAYVKPTVRRTTVGFFAKEDTSRYLRAITLLNTRASLGSMPAQLLVLDQVPVSEDEKMAIQVVMPMGLSADAPAPVPAGTSAAAAAAPAAGGSGDKSLAWGKATATMKKDGIVSWDVRLDPGKGCRLELEYVVSLPMGDGATQC